MDKVETRHKTYDKLQKMRDKYHALEFTEEIQEKAQTYLPKYPAESDSDYNVRLNLSTIDGLVFGGRDTLCGAVFYGDIDVSKVNASIVPLLENIDNKGNAFNVFARESFEASFDGFSVIFVDMPEETDETKALRQTYGAEADKMLKRRPYWRLYTAASVTNHRYRTNETTQIEELEMITFHEPVEVVDPKNRFGVVTLDRYRVFFLEGAAVKWELWEKKEKADADGQQYERIKEGVLQGRSAIPVAILGKLTDKPKLAIEVNNEVKAYQKESSFDTIEYLSVPQLLLIGRDKADQVPVPYGPSTYIDVPVGGDGKFISIDSKGHESLKGTIQNIKEYIKARLNELTSAAMESPEKTATQVAVEDKDKQARLIVWAEQAKDAWELALAYTAEAMGLGFDKGGEIVLNTKWAVSEQKAMEREQRDIQVVDEEMEIKRVQAERKGAK